MTALSEVKAFRQGGLLINEPDTYRTLKNLSGTWSDLALDCLFHMGM